MYPGRQTAEPSISRSVIVLSPSVSVNRASLGQSTEIASAPSHDRAKVRRASDGRVLMFTIAIVPRTGSVTISDTSKKSFHSGCRRDLRVVLREATGRL